MSQDLERSVLSAIIQDDDCLLEACDILTPEDFWGQAHQDIYACIIGLAAEAKPTDAISIIRELETSGKLERVGGRAAILGLTDDLPDVTRVAHHAKMIRDDAIKRRLSLLGKQIVQASESLHVSASDALDKAHSGLMSLRTGDEGAAENCRVIADRVLDPAIHRDGPPEMAVNRTRIAPDRLSAHLGGLGAGQLVIVAGRPGTGKSALGVQMGAHVARVHPGRAVLISSLEMTREEVLQRVAAASARVNLTKIVRRCLNDAEAQKVADAKFRLPDQLWVDDRSAQTLLQIRAQARRLKSRSGLSLVVVDYLQLMGGRQRGWTREETVSTNAYGLKSLAKDLSVPVVALAQLNRGPENEKRDPRLADLRESGAIEQAADVVIFISREEGSPREATIIVAKQRHGPLAKFRTVYEGEFTLFSDLDPMSAYEEAYYV